VSDRGHDPQAGVLVDADDLAGIDVPEPATPWLPGQVEAFSRPTKSSVELSVWGSSGGWLVVQDQYAAGWRATVDGVEVPLVRADQAFRALPLPRGDSTVRLTYEPPSVRLALVLLVVGLGGAALLALLPAPVRSTAAPPAS